MELEAYEAAIPPFVRLQAEFPEHPLRQSMLPRLAYALEQTGQPSEALDIWQAHIKERTDIDEMARLRLQLHMGRLALQAKRFDDALTLLPETDGKSVPKIAASYFGGAEVHHATTSRFVNDKAIGAHEPALGPCGTTATGTVCSNAMGFALDTYRRLRNGRPEMIANAERRIADEAGLVRRALKHAIFGHHRMLPHRMMLPTNDSEDRA